MVTSLVVGAVSTNTILFFHRTPKAPSRRLRRFNRSTAGSVGPGKIERFGGHAVGFDRLDIRRPNGGDGISTIAMRPSDGVFSPAAPRQNGQGNVHYCTQRPRERAGSQLLRYMTE